MMSGKKTDTEFATTAPAKTSAGVFYAPTDSPAHARPPYPNPARLPAAPASIASTFDAETPDRNMIHRVERHDSRAASALPGGSPALRAFPAAPFPPPVA